MVATVPAAPMRGIANEKLWQVRRLFTVDDYYRMGEAGLIGEDEHTELLDGEVVLQMPINSRHAGCVKVLNQLLMSGLLGRAIIGVQDPVRLGEYSEPQPDVSVLAPREDAYRLTHPEPGDVMLLVEVSVTSLDLDRRVKVPLYASAGIAEVWVVDLVNDSVEVYREPDHHGYRQIQRYGRGQVLSPSAFADVQISVDDVLGPI